MTAVGWNNDGSQASETWEYTSWYLVSYLAQSVLLHFKVHAELVERKIIADQPAHPGIRFFLQTIL
jgi:hypothetical protein